jgi:uncharacterized repeat protein (TIGR01451 family)/uncharacterized delta-60 repeat protein
MFTIHQFLGRRTAVLFAALGAALAFCAGTVSAQIPPPNDNLTNAQAIVGLPVSVTGTNLSATAETNEPAPVPGNPAQASIWYLWTAPYTTTVQINTRGSVDPNTGNQLDTVLAVYSVSGSLVYSNLTLLAANDDDPSGGVVSRVDVPVTVGNTYLIQVDGSTNTPSGSNALGIVELNLLPSLVGGNIGFTASTYFAGEFDDILPVDFGGNPMAPSLHNKAGANNIRITVNRKGGNTGKFSVTLNVTNSFYFDYVQQQFSGTNVYVTNYNVTNNAVISYTNSFETNIATEILYENYINQSGIGNIVQQPVFQDVVVTATNSSTGPNFPPMTNNGFANANNNAVGLTNYFTNFPCAKQVFTNMATNNSVVTISITQVFCSNYSSNYTVPSASNGLDYVAVSTNITFNDFQMSQDFYLQINPGNAFLTGPNWPDQKGNYNYNGINPVVQISLTNAVMDPNEDPDITPVTIDTNNSTSFLSIETFGGNPNNYIGSSYFLTTNGPIQNYASINIERQTFRINKNSPTAYIYVLLTGPRCSTATYICHYTLDCFALANGLGIGTPTQAFDDDEFTPVAGSDYAQPNYWGVNTAADFGVPINDPPDPSGLGVGGNTAWPVGVPYVGTISFPPNSPGVAEIAVPILNNGAVEFDMDFLVQLFETPADAQANAPSTTCPGAYLGNLTSSDVTINFSGTEPGGANDVSFNVDGVPSSYPPNNPVPGANGGDVNAVAVQANGQTVIGGYFSSYNTTPVYGVARLLANGQLDNSFNKVPLPGVNYGGFVKALAIDSLGRIIIGGNFTSFDGSNAVNIARLTPSGLLDTTFVTGIGFNAIVNSLSIDTNGDILVGGDFTSYNATNCNHIARLLPTGGLDTSFLPNTGNGLPNFGADASVRAVTTDNSGNIILGGDFQMVNGSNLVYIARLLPSGALDTSFNPEIGPDDTVYSIAVKPNNELIIGGAFQNYNLYSRGGIALLNTDGSVDTSFTPGSGADNGIIYSVLLQPDGNILIGGQFRSFNSSRRLSLARLFPSGWVDTSFMDTAYNQYAGLINKLYNVNVDPEHIIYSMALQSDGNIVIGGSFTNVGGGSARDDIHSKLNVARIIGQSNPGPQTGGGGIGNQPGNITFTQNPYTVDDTAGNLYVTIQRENGSLGAAQVTLGTNTFPVGPGSATSADFGLKLPDIALFDEVYNHWIVRPFGNYAWRQGDGYYGQNIAIQPLSDFGLSALNLTIHNDTKALQNLNAGLTELNINAQDLLVLGGVSIPMYPAFGTPSANLEIINDNFPPGFVGFSQTNFTAIDTSNSVVISVVRTNGTFGPITVYYYTTNGTAISGINYTGSPTPTSRTELTFDGGTSPNVATFSIPITQQSTVQNTKSFRILLTDANPTTVLDTNIPPILPTIATVTIIDGNFLPGHLSFTSPTYSVLKGGVATVGVQRVGGALGQISVQVVTSNGTAHNGLNYTGVTNTLYWTNQDTSIKTISIPTLQDNTVDGSLSVNLSLINPTNIGGNGSNNNLILSSPSNAVLNIVDSDSYGTLSFAAPNFNVLQNSGQALITVTRQFGATGTIAVNYSTFNPSNIPLPYMPGVAGTNYTTVSGTLVFTNGVASQSFVVPIIYTPNETNAANRVVGLELYNGTPSAISNQFPVFATLTILDNQLVLNPAGSVDMTTQNGTGFNGPVESLAVQPNGDVLAGGEFTFFNNYPYNYIGRLVPNGNYDTNFLFSQAGADGNVYQVLNQGTNGSLTNGAILIAGGFQHVDAVNRSSIARLNEDGSVDETFDPGSGADNTIYSVAQTQLPAAVSNQPMTVAYYVGGAFANFDGLPGSGVARLNGSTNSPGYQGTPDPNFNIGQGVTGSNAIVRALGVQANNQVVLGGDFTSFNGATYNHLVRLNIDGSVDTTFNPSTGTDTSGSVRAVLVQPDGKILIGGLFTNVNGVNLNHLARLNPDGSVDTNFNVGVGGNNTVLAIALDTAQRILVGGEFSTFSGVTRNGITRLNPDGTVDPTINFQSGTDGGYVNSIVVQTNDEIDVGGGFSSFEQMKENNFVRLYGGATTGDGVIQFSQPVFGVLQSGTNAIITLQRLGGEGTSNLPTVSVTFTTSDGTGVAGTDYTNVTTNITFPLGETYEYVSVPIIPNLILGSNKVVNLTLSNPTNGGLGAQSTAQLIITNVNAEVSFSAETYIQSANQSNAIIPIVRTGFADSVVSVWVYTGTNGSATPFTNYLPASNLIVFNPNVMTNYFLVPILNASNMFSAQTVDLEMTNASNAFIGAPSSATLTIASVFNGPGYLTFSQTNYTVSEGATNAVITIIRTNGSYGTVGVTLTTSNGTGLAGINYLTVQTNITFKDSETIKTVTIPVLQQSTNNAGPDVTVYLNLSNPINTIITGSTQEVLTIQNDIQDFSFANSPYFVSEGAGSVTLDIVRGGPLTNTASISYYTYTPPNVTESNGYALPNIDYVPASGTLFFGSNVSFATVPVTILQSNVVNGPLSFQVFLNNPSPGSVTGMPNPALVTILSDVTGFSFATNADSVAENGSNITIWVTRENPATGQASVQYNTSDSSALNAVDYVSASGTLVFTNGQASNSFNVTILNPNIVEGSKVFNVTLSNPKVISSTSPSTNAYLLPPSTATVSITNVLTGVSFGSPSFVVSECSVQAVIPIILTGATNNPVSVVAGTIPGGSAIPGTNYFPVTNAFTFQPGQTTTNLYVQVINNHIIGPNHTVVVALSNPQGATLLNPSTAILTIDECNGAFIVSSGTAFVSGNQSPPGVILANETVTLLLGLRDVAGSDTTNLVATLQLTNGISTNGVANPIVQENYGMLVTNGPTVARQFTFKAVGTNGQNIVASLALQDGSQVYSNVAFGFTLAGAVSTFSTNEILHINGVAPLPSKATSTNAPFYGYPSRINVQGVAGNVTAVSAGISNYGHTYPANVAMVLEAPNGQDTYLMADCGGSTPVSHVDLTFSQGAAGMLPLSGGFGSGTYLPTAYAAQPLALTNGAPAGSYPTSLAGFIGVPANGYWSLFVVDEDTLDSGYVSNGWSLNISTGVPVEEDADLGLSLSASPLAATVSNALTYTISVTNYGPAAATNVVITDTLPSGVTNTGSTNGYLIYNISSLAVGSGVTFSFQVLPTTLGYLTNIASVTSSEPNPNSNNIQTNVTIVSQTSADLGVTLTAAPNPVIDGASVTYTVTVTNNGPSVSTGVSVVDTLPTGFVPVTLTPSQGTTSNASGVITWNVGTLSPGTNSRATLTILAGINLPENILPSSANLDTVSVSSSVYDPAKLNNFASVKTQVLPALITVTPSGATYMLSWPTNTGITALQGAVNLTGPWSNISGSSIVAQNIGGQMYETYMLPGTNGYHYFRLLTQLP